MVYRKKPVCIEAIKIASPMTVETLEGTMRGNPGDYLITGVRGEQYFCKPDIFEETYEPVEAAMPNVHPHSKSLPTSATILTGR